MRIIIQNLACGRKPARSMALAVGVAATLLLSGCGAFGGGEATPLPTRTPLPTFTPTPEGGAPAAQATEPPAQQPAAEQPTPAPAQAEAQQPTQTPAQAPDQTNAQTTTAQAGATQPTTQTAAAPAAGSAVTGTTATTGTTAATGTTATTGAAAAPAGPELVTNDIVNIRQGPGTNYGLVGTAQTGTKFRITGKNQEGTWWQIDYNGKPGWIFGQLVTATGAGSVALAQNIPAPPPTPVPAPPTNTPAPVAAAPTNTPAPAAGGGSSSGSSSGSADSGNYPYILGQNVNCQPNAGVTYFKGFTRDSNNNLINGVCIHIAFNGPRTTKCSGCDGVGDGNWGFSPFGQGDPPDVTVEIFVVQCPGSLPPGGQTEQSGFGDLTPQSPKWVHSVTSGEQCEGITFYKK